MNKLALKRLNLWQKLGALVLAQLVPAVLVGFFYFTTMDGDLSQVRGELQGVRFLQAIDTLRSSLLTHGARAFVFASGDTARRAAVLSEQRQVDTAMTRLDGVSGRLGELYGVSEDVANLSSQWSAAAAAALTQSSSQVAAANDALIDRLNQLGAAVATGSRVASDSDQTTRTLLEIGSEYAPTALAQADDMRRFAVDAAAKSYLGGDDQMGIAIYRSRVLSQFDQIRAGLAQLPPQVAAPLQSDFDTAVQLFGNFDGVVDSQVVKASSLKTSGGAIYDAGIPASHALQKLAADSLDVATSTLGARASSIAIYRDVTALFALLALGAALAVARLVRLSLSRPLTRAIGVFEHIAQGRYDNQIDTPPRGRGRPGAAGARCDAGQAARPDRERARRRRGELARPTCARQGLDLRGAGRRRASDHLSQRRRPGDLRRGTPRRSAAPCRTSTRRGCAARASRRCRPTRPPSAAFSMRSAARGVEERALGGLTFRTVTNPVTGERGERLGTVMEWTQRTQEVRVEEELQGVLAAVNGGDLSRRIDLGRQVRLLRGIGRRRQSPGREPGRDRLAGEERGPRDCHRAPRRSPRATPTCRCAPRSRRPRSKRPPLPWRR